MRELSRGIAGGGTTSEDLAASVVLRGAMALSDWSGSRRRADCRNGLEAQALRKGGSGGDVL
jgi:hypothetical protein